MNTNLFKTIRRYIVKNTDPNSSISSTTQEPEKLPFLDGVRGFAALWVLLLHALVETGCKIPSFFHWDGVGLFIVMSGFLMTYHYHIRETIEPWESRKTWLKFYARRFFRIAPLYYLLLTVAFIENDFLALSDRFADSIFPNLWFTQAYGSPSNFFNHKYTGATIPNILLHLTFLFGLLPNYATSTPLPDWSIGLEIQFYAVFPAIMLALKKFSYFWFSLIMIGVGIGCRKVLSLVPITPAGFAETFPLPSFLPLKINLFLIGILLASAYCRRFHYSFSKIGLIGLAVFLSVHTDPLIIGTCFLIILFLFYNKTDDFPGIGKLIQILKSLLGNRFTTFLADTSYSAYLLHTMIMTPLVASLLKTDFYPSLPGIVRFIILVSIVIPLTYSISWLLYNWVEKSGIRFGKNLLKQKQESS